MTEPVFDVGDKVTPVYTSDYRLTMGKVYVVVKYESSFCEETFPGETFTWPAYVDIHDDRGVLVTAHARRFELI